MENSGVINLQFALLGDSGVGKTSLFKRYFSHDFGLSQVTIQPSVNKKEIFINHLGHIVKVKISVWDTSGMEKYQALMPQYYRATHGFIIVYDVTDKNTFESLDRSIVNADTFATIDDHVKIIVGNKIDMIHKRVVSRAEGLKYAHSKGALFIEASAKSNESVDHIFEKLTELVLSKSQLWRVALSKNVVIKKYDPPPPSEESSCVC